MNCDCFPRGEWEKFNILETMFSGKARDMYVEQKGENRSKPTTVAQALDTVALFLVLLGICSAICNWSAPLSVL